MKKKNTKKQVTALSADSLSPQPFIKSFKK